MKHNVLKEAHEDITWKPKSTILSASSYSVYSKKILLVQKGQILNCFCAVITLGGSSPADLEGASHISQYGMQASHSSQSNPEDPTVGLQHLCRHPHVAACSCITSTGRQRQILGASRPASLPCNMVADAVRLHLREIQVEAGRRFSGQEHLLPWQRTWVYFPAPTTLVPKDSTRLFSL